MKHNEISGSAKVAVVGASYDSVDRESIEIIGPAQAV